MLPLANPSWVRRLSQLAEVQISMTAWPDEEIKKYLFHFYLLCQSRANYCFILTGADVPSSLCDKTTLHLICINIRTCFAWMGSPQDRCCFIAEIIPNCTPTFTKQNKKMQHPETPQTNFTFLNKESVYTQSYWNIFS